MEIQVATILDGCIEGVYILVCMLVYTNIWNY